MVISMRSDTEMIMDHICELFEVLNKKASFKKHGDKYVVRNLHSSPLLKPTDNPAQVVKILLEVIMAK